MTEISGTQHAGVGETSATWHLILRKAGLVYLFSRLCVFAGAAIVAAELRADINQIKGIPNVPFADPHIAGRPLPTSALSPMLDVLSSWDGIWYLRIVRLGYPHHVRAHVTYDVPDARAAFFPAYPMLVRAIDKVLPGGDTAAALFTNFVLGAIAIFLLGVLARRLYGEQIAAKAMVLGAMFPGSFVLSFAYTEALLLVFAMGCLYCLDDRAMGRRRTAGSARYCDATERPGPRVGVRSRLGDRHSQRACLEVARRADPGAAWASSPSRCGSADTPAKPGSGSACRAKPGARGRATA